MPRRFSLTLTDPGRVLGHGNPRNRETNMTVESPRPSQVTVLLVPEHTGKEGLAQGEPGVGI